MFCRAIYVAVPKELRRHQRTRLFTSPSSLSFDFFDFAEPPHLEPRQLSGFPVTLMFFAALYTTVGMFLAFFPSPILPIRPSCRVCTWLSLMSLRIQRGSRHGKVTFGVISIISNSADEEGMPCFFRYCTRNGLDKSNTKPTKRVRYLFLRGLETPSLLPGATRTDPGGRGWERGSCIWWKKRQSSPKPQPAAYTRLSAVKQVRYSHQQLTDTGIPEDFRTHNRQSTGT